MGNTPSMFEVLFSKFRMGGISWNCFNYCMVWIGKYCNLGAPLYKQVMVKPNSYHLHVNFLRSYDRGMYDINCTSRSKDYYIQVLSSYMGFCAFMYSSYVALSWSF